MTDIPAYVAKIASLNGGSIVGKTRIQKTLYFLEEFGAGCDLEFEYHFYGPYSEEASVALDDASALGYIQQDWKYTKAGAKYAVIRSSKDFKKEEVDERRKRILSLLSSYDSISIELAATADFLAKNGFQLDPWAEVVSRKVEKATPVAVNRAKDLLLRLNSQM